MTSSVFHFRCLWQQRTFGWHSLRYVQTNAPVYLYLAHWFMSTIDSRVRQDGTPWADAAWNFWVLRREGLVDKYSVKRRRRFLTAKTQTIHKIAYGTPRVHLAIHRSHLKGSLKAFFFFFYCFWQILKVIFSQILFQCFINSKDCKYE